MSDPTLYLFITFIYKLNPLEYIYDEWSSLENWYAISVEKCEI